MTEIQCQRVTYHRDAEVRKYLYKVNNVSLEYMMENLTVMLSEEQNNEGVVFPSEEEVMNILKGNFPLLVTQPEVSDAVFVLTNQPVAVIWDSKHKKKWYVGFFIDMNKDWIYRTDHVERKGSTDKLWCRPSGWDDVQEGHWRNLNTASQCCGRLRFQRREAYIITPNITEIKDSFNYVCQLFDVWCFTWRFVLLWLVEFIKPIHEA